MTAFPTSGSCRSDRRSTPYSLYMLFAFLAILMTVFVLSASPTAAHADDYSMGPVVIDATVGTDGSLAVTEDRTYTFSGTYHGAYWDIPVGAYNDGTLSAKVSAVGTVTDGTFTAFSPAGGFDGTSGASGTYEVSNTKNDSGTDVVRVKLYSDQSNSTATFRVSYTLTGGVSAWSDTGEVYWKFVSDGWGKPSNDITCTLHLPVPSGTSGASGDIHAWAHGPLNGDTAITSDGATFTVPQVGTSEYAEMRVVFPVKWLSKMTPNSTAKLESIQSEEADWASNANAQRSQARLLTGGTAAGSILLAIGAFIFSLINFRRFRSEQKISFTGEYFRDVPTDDHPAVLGCLWNNGGITTGEIKATLMRLTDLKAIALERLDEKGNVVGGIGTGKDAAADYRITRLPAGEKKLTDPLDKAAMSMLFDDFAPFLGSGDDGVHLPLSALGDIAANNAEQYSAAISKWGDAVQTKADERGFFSYANDHHRSTIAGLGILALSVGVTIAIYISGGMGALWIVVLAAAIASAVACFAMCAKMKPYPAEAGEIMAKLKALRKWLLDFTNLKEDPPESVAVWNRLLVMAVILGVADEVIDQLKVAYPQILTGEDALPAYAWLSADAGLASASSIVDNTFETHAQVSDVQAAESADSSIGGDGGGFSGSSSGGGGFGGGGGGGAF